MNTVFLGLGGNLGDRVMYLQKAMDAISQRCGKINKRSGFYESEAWGTDSRFDYLNCVIRLRTTLNAKQLLSEIQRIEKTLGRKRRAEQYADRTIDIDILFFNKAGIATPELTVPHPQLHKRRFVLLPFAEIAADFVHPVLNKPIHQLLKDCKDRLPVKRLVNKKTLKYICIEGNIGSGKTTLAKALAAQLKANFVGETFEQNKLLSLFYEDPKTYAFPLEYSFLISRYEQLMQAFENSSQVIVSDFSIHKSLWFAKVNLSKKEFKLFEKHFGAIAAQLPAPDLLIHLSTGIKQLKNNILKRARTYEQHIHPEYLMALDKQYKKGIRTPSKNLLDLKILKYDAAQQKSLIKRIEAYLKENFG